MKIHGGRRYSVHDEGLEECKRAPRQREVIEWLADQGRPALLSEVVSEVGCSSSTIRALVARGALLRFSQQPARRPPRHALKATLQNRENPTSQALFEEQCKKTIKIGAKLWKSFIKILQRGPQNHAPG